MKKILYVPSLNLGVILWRIEMYAQALVKMEEACCIFVEYFFNPEANIAWDKVCLGEHKEAEDIQTKLISAFRHFDVIIFQKIQNKEALALIEKYKEAYPNVKVIAEIDDEIGDAAPGSAYNIKEEYTMAAQHAAMSDGIITSTEYLKKSIKRVVGKSVPIHVAPNCINYDAWKIDKRERQESEFVRVGYVGGSLHDEDILIIYKAMLPILKEESLVRLIIRSGALRPDFLKDHPQIDFKTVSWNIDEYPQKLYDLDIDLALAPLRDTNFNRCKSAIKWLEWASLDVPVIASDIVTYHGIRKIKLVSNEPEKWTEAIGHHIETQCLNVDSLTDDMEVRDRGLSTYSKQKFNIKRECKKLLRFFDSL